MIWDELSYSNEHFATFGTFDLLTYAFSGLEYGILKANGADINYLEVLSRNQTAKAYGFIDGVADFSIGALEASIKKAGANYKNLYNYIKSNIDGSCQDNIDTRFRTIKLMSQQALTGLPVYDFYEIDKYIHSKEFRNKDALEALGIEIEIISVGGIGNYVKQKYLQYLDSLEVTDVYYGFGYTAGVLVDIIIGDYLESELVGAVFKDTFNTAQAAPKAEKAVAESGEEVLDQAEKAIESGIDTKIKPSNPYNVGAKPSGTVTKITDKMDEATKRSLMRENEAAETIAQNGYNIEQNPVIEGTTRNPDYIIEGEIFDCYSPAENTKIRNVASTIEEKVIKKGQAELVVLNLDDWKGDVNALVKQLYDYPIEGLKEVIVVHNGSVQSIYP